MMKLFYHIYPLLLFNCINQSNAFDLNEDPGLLKVSNKDGHEICVSAEYFPNGGIGGGAAEAQESSPKSSSSMAGMFRGSSKNDFSSAVTGNEIVRAYGSNGCTGKTLSFKVSHAENRCNYCWDSCHARFDDDSSAHTNVQSVYIPEGVVALTFQGCVGSFGYSDPGYMGVLEPGCHNIGDKYIVHLTFAAESTTTPGKYEVLGKPIHQNGIFKSQMSTEHWMYGPNGIEHAQGGSWYQYVFELLDPTEPRMYYQVGNGGTWLGPTQSEWKIGDPCRCSPLDWPATGEGDYCDNPDLTKCTNGCCGTNGCGGLLQTMEGGSGYWIGKLPTPRVKWTIGAVSKCYKYWTNSPLEVANSDKLECDSMGVIAVSNRLLYPPDGIGFVDDGMLGQAWINTPIGKTRKKDKKRSLTLILDTANFKGPVAYMLPQYYGITSKWKDQNGNYHPTETFENTGMNTGGGAFEWHTVPVHGHHSDESRDIRIPKMQFSFNEGDKTVLMSGGKSWTEKSDLFDPLDKTMNSKVPTLDESQLLRSDKGYVHPCQGLDMDLMLDFEGKPLKLGARITHRTEADGVCSAVIEWDNTNIAIDCNGTHCKLKDTFKVGTESVTKQNGEYIYDSGYLDAYDSTPSELEGESSDVFPKHDFWLNYDRRKPMNLCGAKPARKKLYCRQTSTDDWIAWRWYAFQNQPGFQRLNLPKKQKNFLRRRIRRLHQTMEANAPLNDWLKRPSNMNKLITVDPKLIIEPPFEKMKYGFVPIVVYQGMEKPSTKCTLI